MRNRRSFLRAGAVATLPLALTPFSLARAAGDRRLTVASFGGQLDEVYRRVFRSFESAHGIRIDWVPGTAPGNVAKLQATRAAPEYDVVLFENVTQRLASTQGLLERIDPAIVTHYGSLTERSRPKGGDGAAIGGFVTGLYYRRGAFASRSWQPPKRWGDLARPEFAQALGLERASQVYTVNAVLMLAGGDPARIDVGIDRFAEIARRVRVLEPAAAKHEEKILLGEYLVGVNSSIRTLPLIRRLPDLAFVLPEEGAVASSTMVAPVKNAPNPEAAQAFVNAFLAPATQEVLMRELFYSPAHGAVAVPGELRELGLPDQRTLARMPRIDDDLVVAQRREWTRRLEKALGA